MFENCLNATFKISHYLQCFCGEIILIWKNIICIYLEIWEKFWEKTQRALSIGLEVVSIGTLIDQRKSSRFHKNKVKVWYTTMIFEHFKFFYIHSTLHYLFISLFSFYHIINLSHVSLHSLIAISFKKYTHIILSKKCVPFR